MSPCLPASPTLRLPYIAPLRLCAFAPSHLSTFGSVRLWASTLPRLTVSLPLRLRSTNYLRLRTSATSLSSNLCILAPRYVRFILRLRLPAHSQSSPYETCASTPPHVYTCTSSQQQMLVPARIHVCMHSYFYAPAHYSLCIIVLIRCAAAF